MYRAFKCHSDDKVNSSKYFINVQSKQKFTVLSQYCCSTGTGFLEGMPTITSTKLDLPYIF